MIIMAAMLDSLVIRFATSNRDGIGNNFAINIEEYADLRFHGSLLSQ